MSRAIWPALLVLASSCTPHFGGELALDGTPFLPRECRSGKAYGFSGVELTDERGRRIRIAQEHEGVPATVYYPAHYGLGACASLALASQGSKINGVTNVEGTVSLSCTSADHTVEGTVRFENCH
jgi:hypothetical protein